MKNKSEFITGIVLIAAGLALIIADAASRTGAGAMNLDGSAASMTGLGISGIVLLILGGIPVILYQQGRSLADLFSKSSAAGQNGSAQGQKAAHIEVPAEGSVDAKIIGIVRNLRMENGREGFHVLCEYTDPKTGVRETFTSEIVPDYPGKTIIGKYVKVFFRNRDPENYTVDLKSIHG